MIWPLFDFHNSPMLQCQKPVALKTYNIITANHASHTAINAAKTIACRSVPTSPRRPCVHISAIQSHDSSVVICSVCVVKRVWGVTLIPGSNFSTPDSFARGFKLAHLLVQHGRG